MKNLVLIASVFLFFGCGSMKNTPKIETYKELDSVSLAKNFQFFSIDIPKDWFAYLGSHRVFCLSPRVFSKESLKRTHHTRLNAIHVSIYKMDATVYNGKTIDKLLKRTISYKKRIYGNFKHKIISSQHSKYGKVYIIKYEIKNKAYQEKTTIFQTLLLYKKKQYIVNFSSLNRYYNTYLKDATTIINSFKIKELSTK